MSTRPVAVKSRSASVAVGFVVGALILTGANTASADGVAEDDTSKGGEGFRVAVGADDPNPFATNLDGFDQVRPQDDKQPLLTLAPLTSEDKLWAKTQEPLGDAAALIQTEFPADYAYSYFSELKLVIGFANDAPDKAEQTLAQTGLPFEVAENVGFNEIAYIDEVDRLSGAFSEAVPDGVYFTVAPTPDVSPGRILATFSSGAEVQANRDYIANALGGSDVASPFFLDIEINGDEQFGLTGYGRAAGTWLVETATGVGQCTSAFVAKSTSNADVGVLTAGHCPQGLTYFYVPTSEAYPLNYRNATFGSGGDVMFQRSSRMMDAWFHVAASVGRPVNSYRNPLVNETVCRYGRGTNVERCGIVTAVNAQVQTNYGLVGHQGIMNVTGAGGDSGGPVYRNSIAMGVLSSSTSTQTSFTLISFAQSTTGTRVCFDPTCTP